MTRAAFREHVFKILFRYEFHNLQDFEDQVRLYFSEFPDMTDSEVMEIRQKVSAIVTNMEAIDAKLAEKCVGWSPKRIGKAELAILRLAIYEIVFDSAIEKPISINEAVVLSKTYCDEKAHSFVNGVLAKLD